MRDWQSATNLTAADRAVLQATAADAAPKVFMLWGAHAQAKAARIAAESRLGGSNSDHPAINTTLANLRQKRAEAAADRAHLLTQFEEGYPAVAALTSQVAELDAALAGERLDALSGPGGVSDCGNAQNCVKVCPKEIPLTESIGEVGRSATFHAIASWFGKK